MIIKLFDFFIHNAYRLRDLMKYTLRQLEVFLAVARIGNITAAAEELSMSQPAASGAIKELEDRFNIQLFDRIGKRLQINRSGLMIQMYAEELIDRARVIEQVLTGAEGAIFLKVGTTMTIGGYLAIDILSGFKNKYPDAQVNLEVSNTAQVVDRVINYQVDIGLIEGEVSRPEIKVIPWLEDELVVVCSPEHPFAKKAESGLSSQDLVQIDWIMREEGSGTRQAFERVMYGLLQDLNYVLELEHIEAIKHAVTLNMGVACLSKVSVEKEIKQGKLIQLKTPDRTFKRFFHVVLHNEKFITTGVKSWLDYCGVEV